MVNEAEANKDADKKKREAVEAHQLDSLIFTAEKSLKDGGDKVPAEMIRYQAEIASAKRNYLLKMLMLSVKIFRRTKNSQTC